MTDLSNTKNSDYQLSNETVDNTPKDELTEQLLVYLALCKLGDKTAFAQLYQLTSAKLNGIAYRITKNIDTANKVLEQTFILVWQSREKFSQSEPFSWLVSIVRYLAYESLRNERRVNNKNSSELFESNIDAFYNAFGEYDPINSSKDAFNDCLSKLEQKQSKAILMAYLYGNSYDEIANYFSIQTSTVKSWIRRGFKRLELCLNN